MHYIFPFFISLLAFATTQAKIVDIQWNIDYVFTNPDGLYTRKVVGVNERWPPLPIMVSSGDLLRLHVRNRLDKPTSIHHHGLDFRGVGMFDGAMDITQCGIPPGGEFTYQVDTTGQSGTYWIHAHSNGQYVDGLRAPFIIQPSLGAIPNYFSKPSQRFLDTQMTMQTVSQLYDDEYTVIMSDWYHEQHADLLEKYLSPSNPEGHEPTPNSGLLYFSRGTTYLPGFNNVTSIQFKPNQRYRLRLLNIGALAMFQFKIDGHQMHIIEVDGTDVVPYEVESIPIDVAQRYSIVVTAKSDASTNYLIQANMDASMFSKPPSTLQLNYTSTLVYSPAAQVHPIEPFSLYNMLDERAFTPQVAQAMLTPTRTIELKATFMMSSDGTNRGFINNVSWVPPQTPTLMTVESVQQDMLFNPRIYGPQTNAHILQYMEVIDLLVTNLDSGGHPFHLHGHKFQVIDRRQGAMSSMRSSSTVTNPMRRDTIHIGAQETVRLRFQADNPAVFLFHCHIEWHLQAGLGITFVEAPDRLQQETRGRIPSVMRRHCAQTGHFSSGNAAGNSGDRLLDLTGAPQGPYPQP
ncbi:hypothetical protein CROQUDRAFT_43212 [Cronartium quercuum f. sp. fusiforme G11]|uniref:Laccase n=1 Tax=Cronartium quercuum f. sp. fusiforme G11 TaxID=708437 RepID=A0A9P6NJR6_9BASI|nr:hypothetical protein CROQUDRAFT_43212 [Cronartium quercuum f. sp. fusiforme G11]